MKAIIVPGAQWGTGDRTYSLITEEGEVLCSHVCSSPGFAPGDLYANRPERKPMFDAKGITEFVWLQDSGIDEAELLRRNHAWAEAEPEAVK